MDNIDRSAVLRPISEDGGIIVPQSLPQIRYAELCGKDYAECARVVLDAFLKLNVDGEGFSQFDDDPATVVKLDDNMFFVELWHGQTRSADDIIACTLKSGAEGLTDAVYADNRYCDRSDIAAVAALTVCFFSAYCDLVNNGEIKSGDKIDFVAPASSFEFVLAGWYARRMGLPVNRLLCACGTDGALYDFIRIGAFDTSFESEKDKALADNILRLVYDVDGNSYLSELNGVGRFSVTPDEIEHIRDVIAVDYADGATADEVISDLFDEYGYVADPDTAVAYAVAAEREFVRPTVVLSARDPFLSAGRVLSALGERNVPPDKLLDRMEELTATDCPEYVRRLLSK